MKNLDDWCKGRNALIAFFSRNCAMSAEAVFEILKAIKTGEPITKIPQIPSNRKWLDYYRSHRFIEKSILEGFKSYGGVMAIAAKWTELIIEASKIRKKVGTEQFVKDIQTKISAMKEEEKYIYSSVLQDVKNMHDEFMSNLVSGRMTKELKRKLLALEKNPEFLFYSRIHLPCIFLYQTNPSTLLRKSRQGNRESLEILLRLDKSIISDPKISKIFHLSLMEGRKGTSDLITDSLKRNIKAQITLKKVKMAFAGLISSFSHNLGLPLQEPDIRALFDAAAMDLGNCDADFDLPDSPEAFSLAIWRERKPWRFSFSYPFKN